MTDPYIGIDSTKIDFFDNELGAVITLKELSDGTHATPRSGWIAAGTFTYNATNKITVASGAVNIYQIGDKIRFYQDGGWKNMYITVVADTLLTVTGGTDFTVANSAITSAAYSHTENPVGFSGRFNYVPTFTGFSTDPTGIVATFKVVGRTCFINITMSTAGVSNANTFTVSLPITAATISGYESWHNLPWAYDNSATSTTNDLVYILSAGTVVTLAKAGAGTGWTATNNKRAMINASYEI